MTPSANQDALKNAIDNAKPETISDAFRTIALGDVLRDQIPQVLRKQQPAADPSQLASVQSLGTVAKGAPAAIIMRARSWAGTATPQELAPQAYGTAPAAGQIAVAPNGDIVVNAADAWTDMDVTYIPERGDIVTLPPLPVVAGVLTLPSNVLRSDGSRTVLLLVNATATAIGAGGISGAKAVVVPAGTQAAPVLPATTQASLSIDGLTVEFNSATDKVTQAQVTLLVVSAADLDTLLEQSSNIL